jgi:hypothetical protein
MLDDSVDSCLWLTQQSKQVTRYERVQKGERERASEKESERERERQDEIAAIG